MDSQIKIKDLLKPVSEDHPTGQFLLYDNTYQFIKEAAREDDPTFADPQKKLKKADWKLVIDLCIKALKEQTKDLQICVWLLEAFIHRYHFSGLTTGFELILGMCERYWEENLHPDVQNDDIEYRLAPFHWINEKLSIKMKLLKITDPQSVDYEAYSYADFEKAQRFEALTKKEKEKEKRHDLVTMDNFKNSANETPSEFFEQQKTEIQQCFEIISQLNIFLDTKCGKNSPGFKPFKDVLSNIINCIESFTKPIQIEHEHIEKTDNPETEYQDESVYNQITCSTSTIRSRDDAYRLLSIAANYLLENEPHSPVPLLINRAISWKNMSLMELCDEILKNKEELKRVNDLFGIKPTNN
jgi:type VI secretion system ImpA family protein